MNKTPEIDSFSFDEIISAGNHITLPQPEFFTASDGIKLAYYSFIPDDPAALLVFFHGGGAFSGGGYAVFASNMAARHGIAVILADIRGHGNSGGTRGHAPSKEQCWIDIKNMIVKFKAEYPGVPLWTGGHSSGAGLVLNYASWDRDPLSDGYIFLSPQLGYKSGTKKISNRPAFARVNLPAFIVNSLTGGMIFGGLKAVHFNYPRAVLAKNPLFISSISVNMANAMTPYDPAGQFKEIGKPYGLFAGENDELFDAAKVMEFFDRSAAGIRERSRRQIIPGANHLSVLVSADAAVAEMIRTAEKNGI